MISMESPDPKKEALRREVAEQVAEWESRKGKIGTAPIRTKTLDQPFSITTKGGVAKRNPDKPTNLDMEDGNLEG